jgi:hypothetical protein
MLKTVLNFSVIINIKLTFSCSWLVDIQIWLVISGGISHVYEHFSGEGKTGSVLFIIVKILTSHVRLLPKSVVTPENKGSTK